MSTDVTLEPDPDLARMKITVTITGGAPLHIAVYRHTPQGSPWGSVALVRGGALYDDTALPTTWVIYDYEAPLGVSVGYSVAEGATEDIPTNDPDAQATEIIETPLNQVWLKDPGDPSLNQPLCCPVSLPDKTRAANFNAFRAIGESVPLVSHDVRSGWAGELIFATTAWTDIPLMDSLFIKGGPLLLQTRPEWGDDGGFYDYVQPGDVQPQKYTIKADLPARRWTVPVIETQPPYGLDDPLPCTFETILNTYNDFDEVLAAFDSFDDMLDCIPGGP